MRSTRVGLTILIALNVLAVPAAVRAQKPSARPKKPENPYPYLADEPKAKEFSLSKTAEYLDGVARFWMQTNSCGACHVNFAYLMARPLLEGQSTALVAQTRRFMEQPKANPPPGNFSSGAESVAIAFSLAWDDARSGRKLQQTTRQALDRLWQIRRPNGTWSRLGCGNSIPAENDIHYTAILAALAVSVAPEGYARSAQGRDGLNRLRGYFAKSPPRDLHDQAMRLWASLHVDGLMTAGERAATIKSLLATQQSDGGWSHVASPSVKTPSDGYGTGLFIYVLRQAGVPADRPEIVRGVGWLRSNQRVSGRWFTPSPAAGEPTEGGVGARDLYAQNLGTAFAVLALKACDDTQSSVLSVKPRPPSLMPGLAHRARLILDRADTWRSELAP
jgi:squalene-hopene/tetraprenyl-beta-curcumene cyclase